MAGKIIKNLFKFIHFTLNSSNSIRKKEQVIAHAQIKNKIIKQINWTPKKKMTRNSNTNITEVHTNLTTKEHTNMAM